MYNNLAEYPEAKFCTNYYGPFLTTIMVFHPESVKNILKTSGIRIIIWVICTFHIQTNVIVWKLSWNIYIYLSASLPKLPWIHNFASKENQIVQIDIF